MITSARLRNKKKMQKILIYLKEKKNDFGKICQDKHTTKEFTIYETNQM